MSTSDIIFHYGRFAIVGIASLLLFLFFNVKLLAFKCYIVLFRYSGICSIAQSWAGLNETLNTFDTQTQIGTQSKLHRVDGMGFQEWSTPFGTLWFPPDYAEWTVLFALAQFRNGAYPGIIISPDSVVLDCGGYVGDWTTWALRAGAGKSIVFEPDSDALECIRRNLAKEIKEGRVIVYAKGVWDQKRALHLRHTRSNPAANMVTSDQTSSGESIKVVSIDEIVDQLRLTRLDVLLLPAQLMAIPS